MDDFILNLVNIGMAAAGMVGVMLSPLLFIAGITTVHRWLSRRPRRLH